MLFSIKDVKSGIFGAPRVAESVEEMKRAIELVAEYDKNSLMSKFPADFSLYCIGDFDDYYGIITSNDPTFICNLSEIITSKKINVKDLEKIEDIKNHLDECSNDIASSFIKLDLINSKNLEFQTKIENTLKTLDSRLINLERRSLWQSMKNSLSFKKF